MKNIFEKILVGITVLLLLKIFSLCCMIDIFTHDAITNIKILHFIGFYTWVASNIGNQLFRLFGSD